MFRIVVAILVLLAVPAAAAAQSLSDINGTLKDLVSLPAVSGHEQRLASVVADRLRQRGLDPKIDVMSNVTVTVGSGKPHRLLVANLDEPGYVVSGITDDGYLRLQRVGTARKHIYFDQYFEGQRLFVTTASGRVVNGVSAIPSTHLARGATRADRAFTLADAYVDVGTGSAAAVDALGIRLLDPVSIEKSYTSLVQDRVSAPFLSDRAGAAVLLALLSTTPASEINGTVTVAFTAQEHFGRRGIDRLAVQFSPDEVYAVETIDDSAGTAAPGAGQSMPVWADTQAAPGIRRMLNRFEGMVRETVLRPAPNTPSWGRDTQVVRIGIPLKFHSSPVEVIDLKHLQSTIRLLRNIVQSGVS